MKRIFVVYNPRSSRYSEVRREVVEPLRKLKGYIIGKYEIKPTSVDDNIASFSKLLKADDLVISAGGDATGVICANAILRSKKDVTLAVLPYGNFNDLARTLGTKTLENARTGPVQNYHPLEIWVDDKFYRYATCYVTIGMTAEAVHLYDEPKMRKKLKTAFGRKISSYTELAAWYFKNRHKKQFLPEFTLNGERKHPKTSDYAAINGHYMARVMKGGEDYKDPHRFRSETDRLTTFYRLVNLMLKSIFCRIPGRDTTRDCLLFNSPATITLQAEGENIKLKDARKIEIKKGKKCLKVITN